MQAVLKFRLLLPIAQSLRSKGPKCENDTGLERDGGVHLHEAHPTSILYDARVRTAESLSWGTCYLGLIWSSIAETGGKHVNRPVFSRGPGYQSPRLAIRAVSSSKDAFSSHSTLLHLKAGLCRLHRVFDPTTDNAGSSVCSILSSTGQRRLEGLFDPVFDGQCRLEGLFDPVFDGTMQTRGFVRSCSRHFPLHTSSSASDSLELLWTRFARIRLLR